MRIRTLDKEGIEVSALVENWGAETKLAELVNVLCEKGHLNANDVAKIVGNEVDRFELVLDPVDEDEESSPF